MVFKNRVNTVLLDKDGTLLHFERTWAPVMAALIDRLAGGDAAMAAQYAERLGFAAGQFRPDSVAIAGSSDEVIAALTAGLPRWDQSAIHTLLAEASLATEPVAMLPLKPILSQLTNANMRLGLVTNDDVDLAHHHLRSLGIASCFEVMIGADSGHGSKPDAGPCLAAADRLGVTPEQCIMVGDSLADMQSAKAAGMTAIGVLSGYLSANDFVPYADFVLPDIAALPAWLLSGPGREIVAPDMLS